MSPYVEEPDIPEGMTIHEYKLARDIAACPLCPGLGVLLGALGRLVWWRCRDCGIDFSTKGE